MFNQVTTSAAEDLEVGHRHGKGHGDAVRHGPRARSARIGSDATQPFVGRSLS